MIKKKWFWVVVVLLFLLVWVMRRGGEDEAVPPEDRPRQVTCPVTGQRCSRDYYVIVDGYRLFGCQPGCVPSLRSRAEKHIATIRSNGEEPELADYRDERVRREQQGH